MPFNPVTSLFSRVWKFVDTFAAAEEINREDLDTALDDLAGGVNAALQNNLNFVGEWIAAGTFPAVRPDLTAIRARDTWRVTTAGTVGGVTFAVDDYLVALVTEPSQIFAGSWMRIPNLFLPAVLEILALTEVAASNADASADASAASALAASGSAGAAAGSAASALAALSSVLAVQDSLPSWRGPWVTATAYAIGDLVNSGGSTYICLIAHTAAASFATDLSALRWAVFAAQGSAGAGTGDLLAAQNLADLANKGTARQNLETAHYVAAGVAPASPAARMLWRDTSVSPSVLRLRNDANDAWLICDFSQAGLLGAASITISDMNAHTLGGVFNASSGATGAPLGGEAFRFTHWPGPSATTATQLAQGATSGRLFIRSRAAGVWGAWGEMFNHSLGGQIGAGVTAANDADGTFSTGTYTPATAGGNFKSISNAGAFTLAAPVDAGVYTMLVEVTNATGAGAVTFSGFASVGGDILTTTVGHRFQIFIAKSLNGVTASAKAMQ